MQDKIRTLEKAAKELMEGKKDNACQILKKEYPFEKQEVIVRLNKYRMN